MKKRNFIGPSSGRRAWAKLETPIMSALGRTSRRARRRGELVRFSAFDAPVDVETAPFGVPERVAAPLAEARFNRRVGRRRRSVRLDESSPPRLSLRLATLRKPRRNRIARSWRLPVKRTFSFPTSRALSNRFRSVADSRLQRARSGAPFARRHVEFSGGFRAKGAAPTRTLTAPRASRALERRRTSFSTPRRFRPEDGRFASSRTSFAKGRFNPARDARFDDFVAPRPRSSDSQARPRRATVSWERRSPLRQGDFGATRRFGTATRTGKRERAFFGADPARRNALERETSRRLAAPRRDASDVRRFGRRTPFPTPSRRLTAPVRVRTARPTFRDFDVFGVRRGDLWSENRSDFSHGFYAQSAATLRNDVLLFSDVISTPYEGAASQFGRSERGRRAVWFGRADAASFFVAPRRGDATRHGAGSTRYWGGARFEKSDDSSASKAARKTVSPQLGSAPDVFAAFRGGAAFFPTLFDALANREPGLTVAEPPQVAGRLRTLGAERVAGRRLPFPGLDGIVERARRGRETVTTSGVTSRDDSFHNAAAFDRAAAGAPEPASWRVPDGHNGSGARGLATIERLLKESRDALVSLARDGTGDLTLTTE